MHCKFFHSFNPSFRKSGLVTGGENFLDYGTGSGILGIAALKFAKDELRSPQEGFPFVEPFRFLLRACQTVYEKQTKIYFTRGIGCEP
ncbi:hypothetical protein Taro_025586 [Colocasia esculenta]|uniref:Uncharacterized protein n=1 Tax=Colocasia esculenta TaxID=4460 RepID=A0A843V988_COLES|nr:hypothetical protein [Colocasia esculenta]